MVNIDNDCSAPKNELYVEPHVGEQKCDWGYHRDPVTLQHLKKFFEVAREIDPVQPLTACLWRGIVGDVANMNECKKFILENSDVLSYHCYADIEENVRRIRFLKQFNRPIFNTEWLGLIMGCIRPVPSFLYRKGFLL